MPTIRTYLDEAAPEHATWAASLAVTQTTRCLGCGEAMPGTTWEPHGTCRPYYGVGQRVDYAQWEALVRRFADVEGFDRWAEGDLVFGVPSYFGIGDLLHIISGFIARQETK